MEEERDGAILNFLISRLKSQFCVNIKYKEIKCGIFESLIFRLNAQSDTQGI
jgi:hypothetical protein